MTSIDAKIVVVGAGVFGLTISLELNRRGNRNITVLDRCLPPVPDGSSVDISRIVRADYADPVYMKMAAQAEEGWKTEYAEHYHSSGIAILSETPNHPYIEKTKALFHDKGHSSLKILKDSQSFQEIGFQQDVHGLEGYSNPLGGWAESGEAIRTLASQCSEAGISFIVGPRGTVVSLVREGARVHGVNVQPGPPIEADQVILAAGAWTVQLLDLSTSAIGTCQPVSFTQLTEEEAAALRDMPITINLSTGFFVFPPTPGTNILKCARHGYGYESPVQVVSGGSSREVSSPGIKTTGLTRSFLPQDAEEALHSGLRQLFPASISERAFMRKRLCWYTDTPKSDFIVSHHPEIDGLFLATGGSGHAFKFLPVLGSYTADVFEGKASDDLQDRWALRPGDVETLMRGDGSRGGPPRRRLEEWEQAKM